MAGSTRKGKGEGKSVAGIEVANFGPIVEADVDLRPLTVFVGPSNTGKSYLAMLIYALHRFASDPLFHGFRPAHRMKLLRDIPVEGLGSVLRGWLEDVSLDGRPMVGRLPTRVSAVVRRVLAEPEQLANALGEGIASSLGFTDLGHLVRHDAQDSATVAWRAGAAGGPMSRYSYTIKRHGKPTLTGEVPATLDLRIPSPRIGRSLWLLRRHAGAEELSESDVRRILADVADLAFCSTVGQFNRRAHYLPADRTGIMHAHSMVVRSLIGQASHAGIRRQVEVPLLSGVLADFLENLIDLPSSRSQYGELVGVMESDLLRGSVESRKSDTGYPLFSYQPNGWANGLPLMNASSMVSELAPVALYLRHVVKPGELLIIEEPESHLHPAMQVRLAQFLARVAKRGLRLLVTTHSEIFLEALSNVIVLDGIPEAERIGISGSDSTIPQDDVGVWLFGRDDARGSHVREIGLDVESGTFPTQFELVSEALYYDWARTLDRSNG